MTFVPKIVRQMIVCLLTMKYANRKKLESLILLIDFREAFDSLSHKSIFILTVELLLIKTNNTKLIQGINYA